MQFSVILKNHGSITVAATEVQVTSDGKHYQFKSKNEIVGYIANDEVVSVLNNENIVLPKEEKPVEEAPESEEKTKAAPKK